MTFARTKRLRAVKSAEKWLRYGIEAGSRLSHDHMLSIVLRCDWSELCTAFSGTFRHSTPFESLDSIKARNREYSIWSRLLRETVEYFGQRGGGDVYNKSSRKFMDKMHGPFFCGMSRVMAIPEFNLRICAPTSTSRQFAVATRFAGPSGMVIQLNNCGHANADNLRGFDCAWISQFSEESECLFAGGQFQIRVENILHIDENQNFESFSRVLFYFDCMLKGPSFSGMDEKDVKVGTSDCVALGKLIRHQLPSTRGGLQSPFPRYVHGLFEAMSVHCTELVRNLHQIYAHLLPIKDLLLYPESDARRNVFRSEIFALFPNLKLLTMYTTKGDGSMDYALSLDELLRLLPSDREECRLTVKATRNGWGPERPSWLFRAYRMSQLGLRKSGWSIRMTKTVDDENMNEDCLVFEKASV